LSRRRNGRFSTEGIFATGAAISLVLFVFLKQIPDFDALAWRVALLRAEAKCPGLPFGQNSGGPDYINIAIDVALVAATLAFIVLTIRDFRRRRKQGGQDTYPDSAEEGKDDL
jgi:hypothetical protein